MAKPVNNFEFATDTNYATGPDAGTPTKVAPSAGEIDSGFVRGTGASAQHMNYLMGSIQEWLTYVAGLASDSEFLGDMEARAWHFDSTVQVDGLLTANTNAKVVGSIDIDGAADVGTVLVVAGNTTLNSALTVAGVTTLNGDLVLGASDSITMASRSVNKAIPLTFHPGGELAAGFLQPQGYQGGGPGGRGFHFWGDDTLGGYVRPNMVFCVPKGATLTVVRLCGRCSTLATTDVDIEVSLLSGTTVDNNETSKGTDTFATNTGTTEVITLSSPVVSDEFTSYQIELTPTQGSTSGAPDLVSWIDITYTTTHVDENE